MADDIHKMLDAKRQLLLAISHELRSPLTRARVAVELLGASAAQSAIAADLREMETLLSELLETERLNTRHSALNKTPVNVNALLRERVAEQFGDSHAPLVLNLGDDDDYLLLDAARLRLLLKNLLDNALRHNRGAAPVVVTTRQTPSGVTITVRDHGSGIAPEHLPHLTEPFYRVDASRQRKTGGYGLGLYLCRVIVAAHGGQLSIVSRQGEDSGTTITVSLPSG